jgi:hypothetical protein
MEEWRRKYLNSVSNTKYSTFSGEGAAYDETGNSKERIEEDALGKKKKGGLADISNSTKTGKDYFHTEKITIIAQSGSGKTQLAFDLAYFIVGPYKNIIYLNTHFDDKIVVNFAGWCKKAGIGFFPIDVTNVEKNGLDIPKLDHSVYIIDDTYTSTGRPKPLELLIKKLWNKGRWDGNHVIYIAHLNKYLPPEASYNATQIWVDRPYEKYPISEKIPEVGAKWYMLKNALDPQHGKIFEPEITTPSHIQQIVARLKHKKNGLKEDKLAEKKDFKAIGEQGNDKAKAAITSDISKLQFNPNEKEGGGISFNEDDFH